MQNPVLADLQLAASELSGWLCDLRELEEIPDLNLPVEFTTRDEYRQYLIGNIAVTLPAINDKYREWQRG
jgi:hypothetical protein